MHKEDFVSELIIKLEAGGHCIHSAAKEELRRMAADILNSADDQVSPLMKENYELLEEFLTVTDFNALRASDQRYTGAADAVCILGRNADGRPVIRIAGVTADGGLTSGEH